MDIHLIASHPILAFDQMHWQAEVAVLKQEIAPAILSFFVLRAGRQDIGLA